MAKSSLCLEAQASPASVTPNLTTIVAASGATVGVTPITATAPHASTTGWWQQPPQMVAIKDDIRPFQNIHSTFLLVSINQHPQIVAAASADGGN